jgi:glycosyltransferase involved in cell wall biosynthesis
MIDEYRPDIFHLISGYLMSGRVLREAYACGIPTVVTLTDFWFLCPRIQMLRSDGTLSTLPINPASCARCLGEEKRRHRIPARIAPRLMDAYWRAQTGRIRSVEDRMTFLRKALNESSAIISPSQFLRSIFIESGIQPERILFSRQGRDFPGLTSEMIQKTTADGLRVGYIGQISSIKGVHVLLEATRHLPDQKLSVRVFGDLSHFPDYTAQLQRMIEGDKRIELAGVRSQTEMTQILRELDVVVVPSVWYENSPNAILEAFAHRTPVIASNLGGMAELVQHGRNGLLFAPGDAVDLERQLRRILDEPDLLACLREGIEPVKGSAAEMEELMAIYESVVKTTLRTQEDRLKDEADVLSLAPN